MFVSRFDNPFCLAPSLNSLRFTVLSFSIIVVYVKSNIDVISATYYLSRCTYVLAFIQPHTYLQ
jgi:hypothetical protein